jgi:hypothetical protein
MAARRRGALEIGDIERARRSVPRRLRLGRVPCVSRRARRLVLLGQLAAPFARGSAISASSAVSLVTIRS